MSYVIADPEMMTSAASDLAAIGSNVNAAHMAAATQTRAVIPAAADEVSTSIARLFSQHAANYQATAAQAAAFHNQYVQHLTASAGSYAHAEAANTALLHPAQAAAPNPITAAIDALPTQLYNIFVSDPPLQALLFLLLLPIEIPALFVFDVGFAEELSIFPFG